MKEVVLRNFAKLTGKHFCKSLFFNKAAGLRHGTGTKKRPWHRCFCEFCEISKNTFFTEHLWTTASGLATHRSTDAVIMFKRLENSKIYTLQNMNIAGKI